MRHWAFVLALGAAAIVMTAETARAGATTRANLRNGRENPRTTATVASSKVEKRNLLRRAAGPASDESTSNGATAGSIAGIACTNAATCQGQDNTDADASNRIDYVVAENFTSLATGNVTEICWWGAYLDTTGDCQAASTDTFEIRYYADNGGFPGSLLATFSQQGGTLTVTGPVDTGVDIADLVSEYEYSATHASVPVTAGQCYWVEITNNPTATDCVWFWERALDGDSRGLQDGEPINGYGVEDVSIFDHTFCLDVVFDPDSACYPDPPANDDCANALTVTNGVTIFETIGAVTDGPEETSCQFPFGDQQIHQDVWFDYVATCTGTAQVSLCNSSFDTRIAVYAGDTCPVGTDPLGCSDDECPASLQSDVSVTVTEGSAYKIRIGGFAQELIPGLDIGPGNMAITCGVDGNCFSSCEAGAGDCFQDNNTPGCDNVECCETVCEQDEFCCCTEWDDVCAQSAVALCQGFQQVCSTATGNCCQAQDDPGCNNLACCLTICDCDPFCCTTAWDENCATTGFGETGCGAELLCENRCAGCPDGEIAWVSPTSGTTDARQPSAITDASALQGIDSVLVLAPAGALAECFSICETEINPALHPPGSGGNTIAGVTEDAPGMFTLTLAKPLTPGEISRLIYTSSTAMTSMATIKVLPGDVNGDGITTPSDILAVIDALNGVTPRPVTQTDIDRSAVTGPEDIIRVIDLLNGAGAFDAWINVMIDEDMPCP